MKQKINTPDSTERFVLAQYVRNDGTIETYPGYMVSDYGRVASMKGKVMKILKCRSHTKSGHMQAGLYVNGKRLFRWLHRLVLSSFHYELWSKDANEVDHKDRCPTNNRLDNLQWTDRNGNCANRVVCPLKRIRVTHLDDGHTEEFDNMKDCSRAFGKSLCWCARLLRDPSRNGFNAKYNILIEKI